MPFYEAVMFSSNDERKLPFENSFPLRDEYEIEYKWDKLFSDTYYKKNVIQVLYGFVMSHILDFLKDCGIIEGEK